MSRAWMGSWGSTARRPPVARTTYGRFLDDVERAGGYTRRFADEAIVAVVATLEERMSLAEVLDLEAQLPSKLEALLRAEPILDLPSMTGDELVARVAMRLGVTNDEARAVTRVVFGALRAVLPATEARRVAERLPRDAAGLWG